jgi:ABC-type Zn uptake system ZnuABC Zn-binding protein ZnuA
LSLSEGIEDKMERIGVLATVGFLAFAAAGCGSPGDSGDEGKMKVAASMSVFQDMTKEVGGERVEVSTIVPVGATVETFQPSPSDARKISESGLVVQNGAGLESWMQDLIESAGGEDQRVVELSNGLETIESGGYGEHSGEEHAGEDAHVHEKGNPHLWLDVQNGRHYVEGIRNALIQADPEGEETYRQNAEDYLAELEELDGYIEEKTMEIPEENRKLVTAHDAFPYFAEAYGFELSGVVIQNPDAQPGSREVAEIVRTVEREDVPVIFTEPQFNSGLADTIANEADVEVAELYSDTLVGDQSGGSYEEMMRTNIDRIVGALG